MAIVGTLDPLIAICPNENSSLALYVSFLIQSLLFMHEYTRKY